MDLGASDRPQLKLQQVPLGEIIPNGDGWDISIGNGFFRSTKEIEIELSPAFYRSFVIAVANALIGDKTMCPRVNIIHPFNSGAESYLMLPKMIELMASDREVVHQQVYPHPAARSKARENRPARLDLQFRASPGVTGHGLHNGQVARRTEFDSCTAFVRIPSAEKVVQIFRELRHSSYEFYRSRELTMSLQSDEPFEMKQKRVRGAIVGCNLVIAFFGMKFGLPFVRRSGCISGIEDENLLLSEGFVIDRVWPDWVRRMHDVAFKSERVDLEGIAGDRAINPPACGEHRQNTTTAAAKPQADEERTKIYLGLDSYQEMFGTRLHNPRQFKVVIFESTSKDSVIAVLTTSVPDHAAYFLRGSMDRIMETIRKQRQEIRACKDVYMGRVSHLGDGWKTLIPKALALVQSGTAFGDSLA